MPKKETVCLLLQPLYSGLVAKYILKRVLVSTVFKLLVLQTRQLILQIFNLEEFPSLSQWPEIELYKHNEKLKFA